MTSGVVEKIGGIDCYVATPKGEYAKEKVVLYFTDIFGFELINSRVRLFPLYRE